jgi:hypothetical protein
MPTEAPNKNWFEKKCLKKKESKVETCQGERESIYMCIAFALTGPGERRAARVVLKIG